MFRSQIGPVDILGDISAFVKENRNISEQEIREGIDEIVGNEYQYGPSPYS